MPDLERVKFSVFEASETGANWLRNSLSPEASGICFSGKTTSNSLFSSLLLYLKNAV